MVRLLRQFLAALLTLTLFLPLGAEAAPTASSTVTDTYDYDAFGNLIHSTGTSYNNYLFAGEQFDPDLNLYYNRARYLNVVTGRFVSEDIMKEVISDPAELHLYLYTKDDPVNRRDHSGNQSYAETMNNLSVGLIIASLALISILTKNIIENRPEIPFRANHYTREVFLLPIMLGGINSPTGANYFTTDWYFTGEEAQLRLAIPIKPDVVINLWLYRIGDRLEGPKEAAPNPIVPGSGGGEEYWTLSPIPFWSRFPIIWPLDVVNDQI